MTEESRNNAEQDELPPLLGSTLQLGIKSARRVTWMGAGWACLCGALAAGVINFNFDSLVRVLLTIFLADIVLGAAWIALFRVRNGMSEPRYFVREPQSVIGQDIITGAERHLGVAATDRLGVEAGFLSGIVLLLGFTLGREVSVVVLLGLLFPLIVWFALGPAALHDNWARVVFEIGIPWTLGLAAFTSFPSVQPVGLPGLALAFLHWLYEFRQALALGFLFCVSFYGVLTLKEPITVLDRRVVVLVPQMLVIVLLVWWERPILACGGALLVLAQMLFQPYLKTHHLQWYLWNTQWIFMGFMLVGTVGMSAGF